MNVPHYFINYFLIYNVKNHNFRTQYLRNPGVVLH